MDYLRRIRAFQAEHRLSDAAMARHAGLPYRTLLGIVRHPERSPRTKTAAAIERALTRPPAQRLPRHAGIVAARWGKETSDEIGLAIGITGARVRAIAARMGLTRQRHTS